MIRGVADPRWDEWERVTTPALVIYADGGIVYRRAEGPFHLPRASNVTRLTSPTPEA